MSEFSSSALSTKIDQRSVLDYMIEEGEDQIDDKEAYALELHPEDEAYIPSAAEIYEAYRKVKQEMCLRLQSKIESSAFAKIPAAPHITKRTANLASEIAEIGCTLDHAVYTLAELENDFLDEEGMHPLNMAPLPESLQDIISTTTITIAGIGLAKDDLDEGAAVFAHRATNMYYVVAADLLTLAKPISEENDDDVVTFAARLLISFLPAKTQDWIDASRKKAGYESLRP